MSCFPVVLVIKCDYQANLIVNACGFAVTFQTGTSCGSPCLLTWQYINAHINIPELSRAPVLLAFMFLTWDLKKKKIKKLAA